MATLSMTKQDLKWQAENDARTLADAKVIMTDSKRLSAAKKAAESIADKQMKEAKAMKKVAGVGGDNGFRPSA